jgi:YD repeat-containing protein
LWIVLSILSGLVATVAALAAFGIRSMVTSTGAYQDALQIVQQSPEARRVLGDRMSPGWPVGFRFANFGSQFVEWSVPLSGSRSNAHLYAVANLIGGRWEFSRLVMTADRGSKTVDLAPPPQRAAVPSVPAGKVYLVPFGLNPRVSLQWAPAYYRAEFGIEVSILPPLAMDEILMNRSRNQLNAEDSLDYVRQKFPALAADPSAMIIAVTSRDIYIPAFTWAYAENFRDSDRFAIISTARFHPPSWLDHLNPQLFQSRVQKMITKNVAILYFGLPLSSDYTSLLSGGVLSGMQTDFMTDSIIGAEGRWDSLRSEASPEVVLYDVPGKPAFWRLAGSSLALPDTSSQVFDSELAIGLFIQRQTDFYFGGQFPLHFARVYTTLDQHPRAFGLGADDSLDTFLVGHMGSYVDLCFADGSKVRFEHAREQSGQGDTYLPANGDYISAVFAGGTWTVSRSDGGKLYMPYRPRARGEYVTVLTGFKDSAGRLYRMERDPSGDLLSITTPSGAWLRFQNDAQHRIRRAEASTGRVVSYKYDRQGRLARVSDSDGHVEIYTYDDRDEMLTVAHASGPPVLTNGYDVNGSIVAQKMQDRKAFSYSYTIDSTSYRDVKEPSLIVDPNGLYTYFNYGPFGYSQSLPERPPYEARH